MRTSAAPVRTSSSKIRLAAGSARSRYWRRSFARCRCRRRSAIRTSTSACAYRIRTLRHPLLPPTSTRIFAIAAPPPPQNAPTYWKTLPAPVTPATSCLRRARRTRIVAHRGLTANYHLATMTVWPSANTTV